MYAHIYQKTPRQESGLNSLMMAMARRRSHEMLERSEFQQSKRIIHVCCYILKVNVIISHLNCWLSQPHNSTYIIS